MYDRAKIYFSRVLCRVAGQSPQPDVARETQTKHLFLKKIKV